MERCKSFLLQSIKSLAISSSQACGVHPIKATNQSGTLLEIRASSWRELVPVDVHQPRLMITKNMPELTSPLTIAKAPEMSCSETSMILARLKREEHPRTNHDSAFSPWKILIGPSDWEDHSLGKEGAERYRVHNLPKNYSSPGLYEFGIAVPWTGPERKTTKLDPDRVVVVYVGQADNVRVRLQQYGRFGAHLENGSGLFGKIFSRGYSVVFRWAPVQNKQDAKKTEAQLLDKFDYAWNKESNGVRRPDDVLEKLENLSLSTIWLPKYIRRLQTLSHMQPDGKAGKGSNMDTCRSSNNFLAQVFKFGRSQPRLISDTIGLNVDNFSICGVILGDDSICERAPIEGRKRCAEHKGMKISGSNTKSIAEEKPDVHNMPNEACTSIPGAVLNNGSPCKGPAPEKRTIKEECNIICGVNLGEGFLCERPPVKGRKRCEEHKGMRIKEHTVDGFSSFKPMNEEPSIICGVNLGEGYICKRQPPKGRKRCEEHKGMRINAHPTSRGAAVGEQYYSICGAATADGSLCRNKPIQGNKRCWLHKGRKADSFFTGLSTESNSLICGVRLQNGSSCSRMPAYGRKRCEQHKGMRVTSYY